MKGMLQESGRECRMGGERAYGGGVLCARA